MTFSPDPGPETLLRPLLPVIQRHLLILTRGNVADAEDLQQEVVFVLLRDLPKFRGESQLSTFVWRVTHNVAVSHLRSWSRRREREHRHGMLHSPLTPTNDPIEDVESRDEGARVLKALSALPERERSLVYLKEIEGASIQDLAQTFRVPVGTIKSRLSRAKDHLARNWQQGESP